MNSSRSGTDGHPSRSLNSPHRRGQRRQKQLLAAFSAVAITLLAACGSGPDLPRDSGAQLPVQYGATVADDPQAALIGRDIISSGGSAADAAVAMYFAMAVTLPSNASLGGGGICLVYQANDRTVETLSFPAAAPASIPPSATRPSAVPGNPRGFYALHARYGRLRWPELLVPAEKLARLARLFRRRWRET
ncbi:MAG: hypothetical protein HC834_01240 [Rhodospirillales bacterium]|nr:hypothetical protein [Rhodospirillales bacterium]